MPSGHNPVLIDQLMPENLPQSKVCASCHVNFVDNSLPAFLEADALVCLVCRERVRSTRDALLDSRIFSVDRPSNFLQPALHHEGDTWGEGTYPSTRHTAKSNLFDDKMVVDVPVTNSRPCHTHFITTPTPTYTKKPIPLTIHTTPTDSSVPSAPHQHHPTHVQPTVTTPANSLPRQRAQAAQYPHPLTDITRLRVRSHGSECLYPRAVFRGIQKSGRNNYDVDVTIMDVNFPSSNLSGYLRIRGLTDDHPDLTTYFDAEIIGTRYGFLTRNWGATEQEDLVHWARFPAFHDIKDELKRPHMKLADRDRSIVFMRWKERFLVPNHRVSEINGASFAGFYYICVDFNPPSPRTSSDRSTSQQLPLTPEGEEMELPEATTKSEAARETRCNATTRQSTGRMPSPAARSNPPVAKMTGFYYHRNSEPYQQLTLYHDSQGRPGSSFELR
ncbi:hypothetical protein DXG03_000799 [Asterophora parasitica]|uniref:Vacuolar import and degradation protein-domain-containing protein n=1 Tax=Asterophora parasitica TaxID=117018 RepID=A0A9P7KF94_9AGAR|nr:hypothetical protein DXG03_000799 [Asterophora parasitica]